MRLPCVVVALSLVTALGGCGGAERPPMGTVYGKVTRGGKPMSSGTVSFTPIAGKGAEGGHVASGEIRADGSYSLTTFDTNDGAILGQHAVTVVLREGDLKSLNVPKGSSSSSTQSVQPRYVLPKISTPPKYANPTTTPLKHTVREGKNEINLELEE